ncbi:MAG: hypothetical protein U9Q97_03730, partial [Acidobacteriota bacterium]|nr:hypothetical protein [Acidobacteriota bacterium]
MERKKRKEKMPKKIAEMLKEDWPLDFKKMKGSEPAFSSVVPFGMQTLFILESMQKGMHNFFFYLRCGKLKYLRPAYASLREIYDSILRPIFRASLRKTYDKAFDRIEILIDSGIYEARIKAAKDLLLIEREIMTSKQQVKLGLIAEKMSKN